MSWHLCFCSSAYTAVSPRAARSVPNKSLPEIFSVKISHSEPKDMQGQLHLLPVEINHCFILLCSLKMCDRLQCVALHNPDFTTDDDSWDNSSAEFEQRFQMGSEMTSLSRSASSEKYEILDNLHVKFNLSKMRSEFKHSFICFSILFFLCLQGLVFKYRCLENYLFSANE